MNKVIMFLAMVFLMVGVVSADRVISDLDGISVPIGSVVAGSAFEAEFSFNYFDAPQNEDDSPLIIQLNVSSNDGSYPVGKGEFWISGVARRYAFFGMISLGEVEFECSEEYEQTIEHPKDSQTVYADDGVFYCYNEEGDLSLDERDEITLDIVSHYAIYPGKYNLSVNLFYLTDERAPFVNIVNRDAFDLYYRENDKVSVEVSVSDGSSISQVYGVVDLVNGTIDFTSYYLDNEVYYFQEDTPVDIVEGNYPLFVFAEDEYNNSGNDSVILKIDRSAPNITLVQPDSSSIYGENDSLIIEVDAVDAKAGLDDSSVMYRLSEIVNGSFCPDSGVIFGDYDCYNSGWVSDWSEDVFMTEINISGSDFTSGSYWLEAGACDILGNCGVL